MFVSLASKMAALATVVGTCGLLVVGGVANASVDVYAPCTNAADFEGTDGGTYSAPALRLSSRCTLGLGDDGTGVNALQNALATCYGVGHEVINGTFDEATEEALKSVQARLGQYPDGRYNSVTAERMLFVSTIGSECSTIITNH